MSDEKTIKYDYQAGFTYYDTLQSFAGLMAGFAFTAIVLILTSGVEISTFATQTTMFYLYCLMQFCFTAVMEVICIQMKVCAHSPKPIFPRMPDRNRWISKLLVIITILFLLSIPMIFLIQGLLLLFAITISLCTIWDSLYYVYRFMPVKTEWESAGWF